MSKPALRHNASLSNPTRAELCARIGERQAEIVDATCRRLGLPTNYALYGLPIGRLRHLAKELPTIARPEAELVGKVLDRHAIPSREAAQCWPSPTRPANSAGQVAPAGVPRCR